MCSPKFSIHTQQNSNSLVPLKSITNRLKVTILLELNCIVNAYLCNFHRIKLKLGNANFQFTRLLTHTHCKKKTKLAHSLTFIITSYSHVLYILDFKAIFPAAKCKKWVKQPPFLENTIKCCVNSKFHPNSPVISFFVVVQCSLNCMNLPIENIVSNSLEIEILFCTISVCFPPILIVFLISILIVQSAWDFGEK